MFWRKMMEDWLKNIIEIIQKTFDDILTIDYKDLISVFYEHMSNRNLAKFISILYNKNEIDIYFEIDKIMGQRYYDENSLNEIIKILEKNGFDECKNL